MLELGEEAQAAPDCANYLRNLFCGRLSQLLGTSPRRW